MWNVTLILLSLFITDQPKSIYDFSFKDIDGKEQSFSKFKGKKILIVNTASKCGYTPQYEDLEKMHQKYGKNLVIIGFPSANFKEQEFSSNAEIKAFCTDNYKVSFLMAEKTEVQGDKTSALFKWLKAQKNPDFTGDIQWNFEKFLIGENGQLLHRFRSKVKPMDAMVISQL